ncbi:unnamed protein product [Gongylonema pulchrum]|uniref:ABC_tran_Xtn domain-containing protein n=1 Tax=Gongylonema pulchrum TaxID=637853 RepID=A0A183DVW1_9BILA|nr:unnamed protein product [Gongylonema pulchrum]
MIFRWIEFGAVPASLRTFALQEWTSTIVIVSHDRSFLNTVCTDIIHLHSKRLEQYKGNYAVFEKTMSSKLVQQQREYEAQQQLRQHTQEFIDKFRYNAKRASMVQSRIKMLERLPDLKPVIFEGEVKLAFPDCEVLANLVLQLDDVSFRYTPLSPHIFTKLHIGSHADSRICIKSLPLVACGFAIHFQGGVVIVSHDEKLISMVCKELWVVKDRTVMHLEGGIEEYKRHVRSQLAL